MSAVFIWTGFSNVLAFSGFIHDADDLRTDAPGAHSDYYFFRRRRPMTSPFVGIHFLDGAERILFAYAITALRAIFGGFFRAPVILSIIDKSSKNPNLLPCNTLYCYEGHIHLLLIQNYPDFG